MSALPRAMQVYEELSTWYNRAGQAKLRDWFLVLAADCALELGQPGLAERLRQRLLHANPHHLLRPFKSFAEAMQSPDVAGYVADLRRNYPLETAEQLLQSTRGKPPESAASPAPVDERELKVFRGRETPAEPASLPRAKFTQAQVDASVPALAPEPAPRMPKPVAWQRPTAPSPPRVEPPRVAALDEEGPSAFGYWVASLLFVVTLALGLGLAVYACVVPFLL